MSYDDWVQAAMADDSLVAQLLITLRHAVIPIHSEENRLLQSFPSSDWRVRQRRTKPTTDSKKRSTSTTVSPSTPLSWSGGTVTESAAADGFEESSRPPDSARSKVISIGGETTSTKRMRKRKNMAELKEEEVLLISEKTHLTKELAAVHVSLENERATNQSLKRLKVDLDGDGGGGDTDSSGRFLLPDLNIPYEDNSI